MTVLLGGYGIGPTAADPDAGYNPLSPYPTPTIPPRPPGVGDIVAVQTGDLKWLGPRRIALLEGELLLVQPRDAPEDCKEYVVLAFGYGNDVGQWRYFEEVPIGHARAVSYSCDFVLKTIKVRGEPTPITCGRRIDVPRADYNRSRKGWSAGPFYCGPHDPAPQLGPALESMPEETRREFEELLGGDP